MWCIVGGGGVQGGGGGGGPGAGGRLGLKYTEDAGLPYFDRAAVIANGKW